MNSRFSLSIINFLGGIIIGSVIYPLITTQPNESNLKGILTELLQSLEIRRSGKEWTGLKFTYLDNYLDHFPEELYLIEEIPSFLTLLAIEGQSVESIPSQIIYFDKLENLTITDSHLHSLAPELGRLKKLKRLALPGNELETIPKEIGALESLEFLLLPNNQITSIPQEIINLTNLKVIDLKNNRLTELPSSLEKLTGLEILFLGQNKFTSQEKERITKSLTNTKIYF